MRFLLLATLLLVPTAFADGYPGTPASVTAAYLEADGAGAALNPKTVSQLLSYTTWNSAKKWEFAIVIRSYDIGEVGWDDDKASVQIIYHVVGELKGFVFSANPSDETIDFDLTKIDGKWKLMKPQVPPHLFIDSAITTLKSSPRKLTARFTSLKQLQALAAEESKSKRERENAAENEAAANRSTEAKLKSIKIPLINFNAISFREALEFLKVSTIRNEDPPAERGFGIVYQGARDSPGPLGPAEPVAEPRITLHAKDISLEEVLQSITKQAGLQYRLENGELQIFPASTLPEK